MEIRQSVIEEVQYFETLILIFSTTRPPRTKSDIPAERVFQYESNGTNISILMKMEIRHFRSQPTILNFGGRFMQFCLLLFI